MLHIRGLRHIVSNYLILMKKYEVPMSCLVDEKNKRTGLSTRMSFIGLVTFSKVVRRWLIHVGDTIAMDKDNDFCNYAYDVAP